MISIGKAAIDDTNLAFGTSRPELKDLIANHMAIHCP
jgi:hypothetical protein